MIAFDSSEIVHWADNPDAHHQLPELVRRLILATVPMLSLLQSGGVSRSIAARWVSTAQNWLRFFDSDASNQGWVDTEVL